MTEVFKDRTITAEKTRNGYYSVVVTQCVDDGEIDKAYASDRLYRLYEKLSDDKEAVMFACRTFYADTLRELPELDDNQIVLDIMRDITEDILFRIIGIRRRVGE